MSYDHVLLPSGVARTPDEVDAYLSGQQGQPIAETVAALAAELNRRNGELPTEDSFLSDAPVGEGPSGTTLVVSSPYDAVGFTRALLFELGTPRDYAVYDPQLTWLMDPAGHLPLTVTHGGAGEFPYLTESLVHLWIRELTDAGPYLIVDRAEQVYIQTYREDEERFTLEYRDGGPDRHFTTAVRGADTVASLIWDWARQDRTRLDRLPWNQLTL